MSTPHCRAIALGDFSHWGRQWLSVLEADELASLNFEPSVAQFCKLILSPDQAPIVFVENVPDSQGLIQQIRKSGQPALILWFGRTFTKEDLAFALQMRIYHCLENPKAADEALVSILNRTEETRTRVAKFYSITRALKALVLQAEQAGQKSGLISEVKSALQRVDRTGSYNEFLGTRSPVTGHADTLPLFSTQDLGDAIQVAAELERTGILKIRDAVGAEGQIVFLQGKPVGAETGIVSGLKAVYRMFTWKDPRFLFTRMEAQECVVHQSTEMDPKSVADLGRAFRARFQAFQKELPPLNLKLKVNPAALTPEHSFTEQQFDTLTSVVNYESVEHILDYSPLPDVTVYEALIHLRKKGAIAVAT